MTLSLSGNGITSANIVDGAITNADINASAAIASSKLSGVNRKNLIINGAMKVAQRGTSASVTNDGFYTDRFKTSFSGLGAFTGSQDSDAPDGFANSLKFACDTADASPSAGDYFILHHNIEGQNLQHLKKGTASAESVTLSFWVKSNKTGTLQINLRDVDNTRNIGATYTIDSADTWEQQEITFAGDTTGALGDDNGTSLSLEFWLDSGTAFSSGAVPTSWEAADSADRNAGGTVNLADSTSNYFQITGMQLELGSTATDFEHRSYGEELALCQRYYQELTNVGGAGYSAGTGQVGRAVTTVVYPTTMRASPTYTASGMSYNLSGLTNTGVNPHANYGSNATTAIIGNTTNGSGSTYWNATGTYAFDAEL